MLETQTFLCLFTVNDDPNFEAMAGDSLVPVVLREARDSNFRRPEPSLLKKTLLDRSGGHCR